MRHAPHQGPSWHEIERHILVSPVRRSFAQSLAGRHRAPVAGRKTYVVDRAEIASISAATPPRARPWQAALTRQRDRSHLPGTTPRLSQPTLNRQIPIDPAPIPRVPSLEAFGRRPPCNRTRRDGPASETLACSAASRIRDGLVRSWRDGHSARTGSSGIVETLGDEHRCEAWSAGPSRSS